MLDMKLNNKEKIGLVLEGGGLRGLFTAGVLDLFLDKRVKFPYIVGVSAGASIGASYVSGQKGRNTRVNIDLVDDKRFLSFRNLFRYKSFFGYDFLFDEIPNRLIPFDYQAFEKAKVNYKVGMTNCYTGDIEFAQMSNMSKKDMMTTLRASCSIPVISPMVNFKDNLYLDGGVADSIPVKEAIKDGCTKVVVILTRERGYRKKSGNSLIPKIFYKKYPQLAQSIINRPVVYNETLDYIEELEREGKAMVFRPHGSVNVKRTEKNKDKLWELFNLGYAMAKEHSQDLINWMG